MEGKTGDPLFDAKIEMLAATTEGSKFEAALHLALWDLLQYFARNGVGPLTAIVAIQHKGQPASVDPTRTHRQQQTLEALAKDLRRYKQPKRKKDTAEGLKLMLAAISIDGRGH